MNRLAATWSLRKQVVDQLSRLRPCARTVIESAALLGYRVEIGLASACSGCDAGTTLAALRSACELDLLVFDPRPPEQYRFRHALTQAAIREALGVERERSLHARIAAALEGLPGSGRRVEQLAHHWSAAGNERKARVYRRRAAREARRLGSTGGA